MKKLKNFYLSFTSGGLFSSVAVLGTVLVGAYISLYSSAILTQLTLACLPFIETCDPTKFQNLLFASCALIAVAITLIIRETSVFLVNNTASHRLQEIIRTTPSKSFLESYNETIREVGVFRITTKEKHKAATLTAKDMSFNIRSSLEGVIALAKKWDGNDGKSSIYRANIMVMIDSEAFKDIDHSTPENSQIIKLIENSKLFLYQGPLDTKISHCSGVLTLEDSSLTVSSATLKYGGTDNITRDPICFPYTKLEFNGQSNPVIPGAPACASFDSPQYLHDTRKSVDLFLKNLEIKNNDYCKRYKHNIEDYYNSIDEAQSILSIPIKLESTTIAVLNVYRNKKGIFRDEENAINFSLLMEPICYQLSKMLLLASEL